MKNVLNTGQRKFTIAMIALIATILLCAFGRLTGTEFVSAISLILAMYKIANVMDKKINGCAGNG